MKKIKYLIVLAAIAIGFSLSSCVVREHDGNHGHYENDGHGNRVWVHEHYN